MEFHARPLFEAKVFQLVSVSINEEQKPSSLVRVTRGKEKKKNRAIETSQASYVYVHIVDRKSGLAHLAFLQYLLSAKTNEIR